MPKPMRKYKADILPELQRDELAKLRARVTELEGHRLIWRRRAGRLDDALRRLVETTGVVLGIGPVGEGGIVVSLRLREALQAARNAACDAVDSDDVIEDAAAPHKGKSDDT